VFSNTLDSYDVLVIGAGLAGAMTARALHQQGFSVAVWEASAQPFTHGASHHHACALYPLIHGAPCFEDHFFLTAYEYAVKTYQNQPFFHPAPLRLPAGKRHSPLWQNHLRITESGTDLISGGWVDPIAACRVYLQDIPVFYGVSVQDPQNLEVPMVILCTGAGTRNFFPDWSWRLSAGQTNYAYQEETSENTIVCDEGFVIPMKNNTVASGGTYRPHQTEAPILAKDTEKNLLKLNNPRPHPTLSPTTGVRIRGKTTLPYIGYINEEGAFLSLIKDQQCKPKTRPKLWILSGFGSRGMVTIPWSVHQLVLAMTGDMNSPVRK
jgi:glycine/D-amino acid oxidase-like deaminating enzyme